MRNQLIAGLASVALVVFGSGAANAAPAVNGQDVQLADVTWDEVFLKDSDDERFYISDLSTATSSDVFDPFGRMEIYIGGVYDTYHYLYCDSADLSEASDTTGDKILLCEPVELEEGIFAQIEVRFYAEGDMVRLLYSLTNNTDSAIAYDYWNQGGYGDAVPWESGDNWEVEQGEDNGEYVGVAVGLPTASHFPNSIADVEDAYGFSGFDAEFIDGVNTYSLAAGASVSYAVFVFHNAPPSDLYPSNDFDSLEAWAADTFDAFDGRLIAGIDDDVFVANWEGGTEQELAETGIEFGGMIGAAALLVVAGAVVLVGRRRKAQSIR